MNRDEARTLQRQIAQTWPGTPLTHEAVDNLHVAIGHLTADEAAAALAHWLGSNSKPPRPNDLRLTHEQITGTGPKRPELIDRPVVHHLRDPHTDAAARDAIARMRAILTPTSPRTR